MTSTQAKAVSPLTNLGRVLLRLLVVALVAGSVLLFVNRASRSMDRSVEPPGFARGMMHGALMPLALPNLVLGQDVNIYALNNTGRLYKLGYTAGVNVCGAFFFGIFFYRLSRLRKHLRGPPPAPAAVD